MKLINAYGSKITRGASGLVTCPSCRRRRRRDRAWYVARAGHPGALFVCPKCWSSVYNSYSANLLNTIRENGWWVYGNLMKYDFRAYYILTGDIGFGDYKEKRRGKL